MSREITYSEEEFFIHQQMENVRTLQDIHNIAPVLIDEQEYQLQERNSAILDVLTYYPPETAYAYARGLLRSYFRQEGPIRTASVLRRSSQHKPLVLVANVSPITSSNLSYDLEIRANIDAVSMLDLSARLLLHTVYQPETIVTDISLPDLDGLVTISLLRSLLGEDIPIIVWSARREPEIRSEAHTLGATRYFLIPAALKDISEKILSYV